jgi:hypothetical protein
MLHLKPHERRIIETAQSKQVITPVELAYAVWGEADHWPDCWLNGLRVRLTALRKKGVAIQPVRRGRGNPGYRMFDAQEEEPPAA